MPNYTFEIQNCKVFVKGGKPDKSKVWGKLMWTDGTADFEQKFETFYADVIATLEANKGAEANFKVSGGMVANAGYGDHKGKVFYQLLVSKIERI